MNSLPQPEHSRLSTRRQNTKQKPIIRPQPSLLHLPKQLRRLPREPLLCIPRYYRRPKHHILRRTPIKQHPRHVHVPSLAIPANHRRPRDDIPLGHSLKQLKRLVHLPHLHIPIQHRVPTDHIPLGHFIKQPARTLQLATSHQPTNHGVPRHHVPLLHGQKQGHRRIKPGAPTPGVRINERIGHKDILIKTKFFDVGMDHSHQGERGGAGAGLEEEGVREVVGKESVFLHLEETGERKRRVGVVLRVGPDDGVVEVDVGVGDVAEDVDGGGEVAAGGEGGDEFGSDEGVVVEVGLEDLGVDLVDEVEVGALVEVAELLLEEPSPREPRGDSPSHWCLHLHPPP
ncbi:hypothetical protein E2542_SST07989 [Spatholobus suberectus]|nr:hypothetical protein E2542_SST07989 [Spatholobus suberectus]